MQHDFILLDRSGSMINLWDEALNSINTYARKLADEKVDTGITICTFDKATMHGPDPILFELIRDRITPGTIRPLTKDEMMPRGFTPLNDAVGKIVTMARAGNYNRVAIIIMTDGLENCSRELSTDAAKALLDSCRARGWQVIFLGANFDNAAQAASYGNAAHATVQVARTQMDSATAMMGNMRAAYGVSGQSMSFSDEDKRRLATDDAADTADAAAD